jgi:hypothetical protein
MNNENKKHSFHQWDDSLNSDSPFHQSQMFTQVPKQESPPSQYNEISIEKQKYTPSSNPKQKEESLFNDDFQKLVQLKLNAIKLQRSRAQSQNNNHSINSTQSQTQNKQITLNEYQSTYIEGKDFIMAQYEKTVDELRNRLAKSNEEKYAYEQNASKSIAILNKLIQRIC